MCILIAEIVMLVGGLYALVAGKIKRTGNMVLEGWRARVAGLFLVSPHHRSDRDDGWAVMGQRSGREVACLRRY